jgi:hypothetical protein
MKKRYQIFSLTDKQIVHYGGDSDSNDFRDYHDTIVCLESHFQFYQLFETLQEAELALCEYFQKNSEKTNQFIILPVYRDK